MKTSKKIALALSLCAFLAAMSPVADLTATVPPWYLEGVWVATADWMGCDQDSAARECAEWTTHQGSTMVLTCCVPTAALGTSDRSACTDGGRVRGRDEL